MEKKAKLEAEADRATELLRGKVVSKVLRHRESEVMVEFADGTRLYVDTSGAGVELSIVGGSED